MRITSFFLGGVQTRRGRENSYAGSKLRSPCVLMVVRVGKDCMIRPQNLSQYFQGRQSGSLYGTRLDPSQTVQKPDCWWLKLDYLLA